MYELIVNFNYLYANQIPMLIVYILGYLVGTVIMVTLVMPLHNYIQCLVAEKCGCYSLRKSVFFTMNPAASFHWIGALSVFLFQMGFNHPIEYKEEQLKKPFLYKLFIQCSGILFYIGLSAVLMVLFQFLSELGICGYYSNIHLNLQYMYYGVPPVGHIYAVFYLALKFVLKTAFMNGILNILPLPPLDAYKLLLHSFSPKIKSNFVNHQFVASLLVFILIFVFLGDPTQPFFSAVNKLLSAASGAVHDVLNAIGL